MLAKLGEIVFNFGIKLILIVADFCVVPDAGNKAQHSLRRLRCSPW